MANLRKKVLGTVSGSVGDILFRTKNGKNYISTKPVSFVPGKDEKSVARRKRFAMATQIAKQINAIYKLRSLWRTVTPAELSPYNQIVRKNYKNVQADSVSDNVSLVPEIGFSVQTNAFSLDENLLRITLNGLNASSGIDPLVEHYFQLVGVLYLCDPADQEAQAHVFLRLTFEELALVLNTDLDFTLNFTDQVSQLISRYQNRKAFLALMTLDNERNVINYSNTFSIV